MLFWLLGVLNPTPIQGPMPSITLRQFIDVAAIEMIARRAFTARYPTTGLRIDLDTLNGTEPRSGASCAIFEVRVMIDGLVLEDRLYLSPIIVRLAKVSPAAAVAALYN